MVPPGGPKEESFQGGSVADAASVFCGVQTGCGPARGQRELYVRGGGWDLRRFQNIRRTGNHRARGQHAERLQRFLAQRAEAILVT